MNSEILRPGTILCCLFPIFIGQSRGSNKNFTTSYQVFSNDFLVISISEPDVCRSYFQVKRLRLIAFRTGHQYTLAIFYLISDYSPLNSCGSGGDRQNVGLSHCQFLFLLLHNYLAQFLFVLYISGMCVGGLQPPQFPNLRHFLSPVSLCTEAHQTFIFIGLRLGHNVHATTFYQFFFFLNESCVVSSQMLIFEASFLQGISKSDTLIFLPRETSH